MSVCVYMCVYVYIHIYIYKFSSNSTEREEGEEELAPWCQEIDFNLDSQQCDLWKSIVPSPD